MVEPGPDTNNRIEELWSDHRDLVAYLQSRSQLRLQSRVEDAFSKTLIIAAASYFETRLSQSIVELYYETTREADALAQFVKKQAIGRRFAQLFEWGNEGRTSQNANSFYRKFGPEFKSYMEGKVREDISLDQSVKAFLEIGNLRNQMVHGNYADFQLSKTVDEVFDLYRKATNFVERFPAAIREFIEFDRSID